MESREQAALRAAGERMARDERFAGARGARYRAAPARARTLQLDGRFASMFTDRQFRVKATLDKRGRPRPETSHENLRRFYTLDEPEREEPEPEPQPHLELDRRIRERLLDPEVDYARGEGVLQSDSSSEEESSQEEESSGEEHAWGELDADADTTDAPTDRLAVCNMDWDNMSAQDIMVLFHSFLPPGGLIHSVSIYPSEYGLKRMQEEEVRGPIELTEKREPADLSDGSDNEEGAAYNMERLRRYQLTRLRYYYALVQCDSASTADHLYAQCDGLEYESSATKLDLRFVPPDCTFSQEPKEVCSSLPELSGYRPRVFTTSALQQARVQLTWDATDPGRSELIRSALHGGQVDDLQLREYLASSSSEDERDQHNRNGAEEEAEGEVDAISKYKRLLAEVSEKEQGKGAGLEMEVTWGLGVKEKAEQLVRKAQAEEKNLTPFEKQMEKRKEKKKQKKLERQQKLERVKRRAGEESEPEEDDAPPDVDMSDPYFAEEFDKPEFRSEHKHKVGKRASAAPETEDERRRRAELELLLEGDGEGENGRLHFSLKNIQAAENDSNKSRRRRKLKQKMAAAAAATDDFQINVKDERFSAVFDSHHFNIDPTDPNYKKTRNMERLIEEKQRRRPAEEQRRQVVGEGEEVAGGGKRSRREAELSVLVKSIRRKTQQTNKQK